MHCANEPQTQAKQNEMLRKIL